MIEQAYDLNGIVFTTGGKTVNANGAGETIAIVDAYGDPNISGDLQTFDANFGIGNDNASGQFVLTVATPEGAVRTNAGWASEESLDVECAHAIAPEANILLVEASSDSMTALTNAVAWAASQTGVVAVSMSWGDSPEFSGETAYDHDFTTPSSHPGVTFVAASGDDSQPNYPSTSVNVLAVGGTTLTVDGSGDFVSESAWIDSGGGTSPYEGTTKPDVAYDADPNTGFLVYDSIPYGGESGWQVVGGTSAGSPQWAAIIALADQGRSLRALGSLDGPTQTIPDLHSLPSGDFNDVTGDGLTGRGSPIGEKIISALVGGSITSVSSSNGAPPSTAASQLAFVQQPTKVVTGSDITPAITVDVEDSAGNVVMSDDSSVTISVASGPGTPSGTLTVAANSGVATFSDITLNIPGSYTLDASDGSLTGATSDGFVVAEPQLAFTQQPTDTQVGMTISPPITVAVEDPNGNVIAADDSTIMLNIASGPAGATLGGTVSATAVNGVATFSGLSLDKAGTYKFVASGTAVDSGDSNAFSVSAAVATHLAFVEQPASFWQYSSMTSPVVVAVEDRFGNVVSAGGAAQVTLAIQSEPGGAELSSPITATASRGLASFMGLAASLPGTYVLIARSGSLTPATSNAFVVVPVPVTERFSFNGTPLSSEEITFQQFRNSQVDTTEGPPTFAQAQAGLVAVVADSAIAPSLAASSSIAFSASTVSPFASSVLTSSSNLESQLLEGGSGDNELLN